MDKSISLHEAHERAQLAAERRLETMAVINADELFAQLTSGEVGGQPESHLSVALRVVPELEAAQTRIAELEARLAAATDTAEAYYMELQEAERAQARIAELERALTETIEDATDGAEAAIRRAEAAEAENARLRAAQPTPKPGSPLPFCEQPNCCRALEHPGECWIWDAKEEPMAECPHINTGAEGTSYCALAEDSVKALEAQLAEANGQRDSLRIEIKEAHALVAGLKQELIERTTAKRTAEAEAARLRAALERIEWVEDEQVALKFCPWCRTWQRDGHKPDCARQAALRDAGRGESD